MSLKYYYTSVSSSLELKKQQQEVESILEGKGLEYQQIDIAQQDSDGNYAARKEMRAYAGDDRALAPQFVNGDVYCGDYDAFREAIEEERLEAFLGL